jgi:hypothetical protein
LKYVPYRELLFLIDLKTIFAAGRSVTEGEVEEMLESGNPAVFTQGVRISTLNKITTNH